MYLPGFNLFYILHPSLDLNKDPSRRLSLQRSLIQRVARANSAAPSVRQQDIVPSSALTDITKPSSALTDITKPSQQTSDKKKYEPRSRRSSRKNIRKYARRVYDMGFWTQPWLLPNTPRARRPRKRMKMAANIAELTVRTSKAARRKVEASGTMGGEINDRPTDLPSVRNFTKPGTPFIDSVGSSMVPRSSSSLIFIE